MAVTNLTAVYNEYVGGAFKFTLSWTNDAAYTDIAIYVADWDSFLGSWGSWSLNTSLGVQAHGATSKVIYHTDSSKQKFYLECSIDETHSAASNEAVVCAVTLTDTITWSSSPTFSIATSATHTDTITWSSTQVCGINFYVTGTDTITWSSTPQFAVSVKTDFAFYLGDITGDVHTYDGTLYSDNGASITSQWRSRRLDFVDQLPQYIDRLKCIRKAIVLYDDISASSMITLYVSMDGGVTWASQTKTVGTGDGTTKQATFHFIKTGYVADIMIETASTDKRFKWHQLVLDVDDAGVNI
jgi:hypothetical protein